MDPAATEESLIAEDVKADICTEDRGATYRSVGGKE